MDIQTHMHWAGTTMTPQRVISLPPHAAQSMLLDSKGCGSAHIASMCQCCEHGCPKDGISRPWRHPIAQANPDCKTRFEQHECTFAPHAADTGEHCEMMLVCVESLLRGSRGA